MAAWLVVRTICWSLAIRAGWGAFPLVGAPSFDQGAPLWSAWVHTCRQFEGMGRLFGIGADTWAMVVGGELALLTGAVAVYRFVRVDELPQTAERATWLWMVVPAMAWTIPVSSWNFAAAAVAVAAATVRRRYFWTGALALCLAAGFEVETALVWPGVVWLAGKSYRSDADDIGGVLGVAAAPLAAFTATVAGAMLAAGRWGISVRTLHPSAHWRSEWAWQGLAAEGPGIAVAVVVILGTTLMVRAVRRDGGVALVWSVPVFVWPLLHDPVASACAALLLTVPGYGAVGRALGDRSRERLVVAACVAGLALGIV